MPAIRKRAFINGNFFTSCSRRPAAEAMVTENGIITQIGNRDEISVKDCEIVDLGGKRVLPGFVDAHMHPVFLAEYNHQISCLPPKIHSIEEMIREIRAVRSRQTAGQWIRGWGYDEGKFSERRSPNRYDLDRGCSDSPVAVTRTCCHILCVNSRALALASITRDTPDPDGGQIDRDEHGEPTGILRENARYLIQEILPVSTPETVTEQLLELGQILSSQGITSVADMGLFDKSDSYALYQAAAKRGFPQRISIYYMWDLFCHDPGFSIPPERFRRDSRIHVAGLKLIGDGSVSGRTAWMNEPYLRSDDCGLPVCKDEEIESAIAFCRKHRCQLSIHAMGGRAIDRIVDRVYREESWTEKGLPCLRVEHVTEPSPSAISKAAEKGFAFVTQPVFSYCEIESYLANLGPERTRRTYPVKTLLERGVPLSFSSDAPSTSWATPSDPLPGIKCSVTRRAWDGTDLGQDQKIDMETAIRLYTREAAKAAGFVGVGQLDTGFHGDFIVLDQDLLAIPPERTDEIRVEQTYMDGEQIYQRQR